MIWDLCLLLLYQANEIVLTIRSLRGRREKGRGRGRGTEKSSLFPYPLPLSTPATQARRYVTIAKSPNSEAPVACVQTSPISLVIPDVCTQAKAPGSLTQNTIRSIQ